MQYNFNYNVSNISRLTETLNHICDFLSLSGTYIYLAPPWPLVLRSSTNDSLFHCNYFSLCNKCYGFLSCLCKPGKKTDIKFCCENPLKELNNKVFRYSYTKERIKGPPLWNLDSKAEICLPLMIATQLTRLHQFVTLKLSVSLSKLWNILFTVHGAQISLNVGTFLYSYTYFTLIGESFLMDVIAYVLLH